MAKETSYRCDFNSALRHHAAHWNVSAVVHVGRTRDFDLCSRHIIRALVPLLNAPEVVSVTIVHHANVEAPKVVRLAREGNDNA